MPELPEVETISQQLNQTLKGLKITQIEVFSKKNFIGRADEVVGRVIEGVSRRAKIILIKLIGGKYLAIHLKLTGQLIFKEKSKVSPSTSSGLKKIRDQKDGPFAVCGLPNKFTRVIVSFSNGGALYFNDLRKFGWMRIISQKSKFNNSLDEALGLEKFGPEANDRRTFTLDYLKKILVKSKKPVKLVIMDQEKLAGVGNIYANEALFRAGIMPTRAANSLEEKEIKILRYWILRVLEEAIKYQGTSDSDEAYRQISGEKGNFQNYLQVYGRDGEKCLKCGGIIKRIKVGGRGTFFCNKCQK